MLNLHSGKRFLAPYLVILMLGQANLSAFAQSTAEPAVNSGSAEPAEKIASAQMPADSESLAAVEPLLPAGESESASLASVAPAADAVNPLTLSTPANQSPASEVSAASGTDEPLVAPLRLSGGASVSPAESEARIESLTKQILLKTIELEKFNLHYSQEVAKQGRWKGWRYAFFGEVNAGMGLAGAIISTGYRGARIHHAAKVKPALQENANFIPMIGSIIGAGAAAMEFRINEYHDLQAGHKGFSPKASVKHVQALRDDLEKLSAEREAMISEERKDPSLAGHVAINEAEGRVLKDLRDQSLQEFQRFHMGARRTFAFQQAQYFFDMAKNTTNAIGYEFAYLSLHRHHRIWNGRAGALWDVSGPLFMFGLGPACSQAAAQQHAQLFQFQQPGLAQRKRKRQPAISS